MFTLALALRLPSLPAPGNAGGSANVLDFAALTPAALASRFGWVRTGAGTMIDSGGAVRYGAHNRLARTNAPPVDGVGWTFLDSPTVAGVAGPLGRAAAFSVTDASASARARVQSPVFFEPDGTPGVFSVVIQQGSSSACRVLIDRSGGAPAFNADIVFTSGVPSAAGWAFNEVAAGWWRGVFPFTTVGTYSYCELSGTGGAASATGSTNFWAPRWQLGHDAGFDSDFATLTESAPVYLMRTPDYSFGVPGLLLEGQATTLLGPSEDFTSATYTQELLTVTPNTHTAPNGTATADTFTESTDAAPAGHYFYASPSMVAGQKTGVKAFIKPLTTGRKWRFFLRDAASNPVCDCVIDQSSGAVSSVSAGSVTVTEYPAHGYYLVEAFGTVVASGVGLALVGPKDASGLDYQGDGRAVCPMWGFNVAPPGSYIPNPGTGAVTRVADAQAISGGALDDLIGATRSVFTVLFEWYQPAGRALGSRILYLGTDDYSRRIDVYTSTGPSAALFLNDGTVSNTSSHFPLVTVGAINRLAISVSGSTVSFVLNGSSGGSLASTFGGAAMADKLRLLHAPAGTHADTVAIKLTTFPGEAKSIAQMQAITV